MGDYGEREGCAHTGIASSKAAEGGNEECEGSLPAAVLPLL